MKNIYYIFVIVFISYIPIFYNIEKPPIFIWDEAIYANNALEMAIHKNFIVLQNNGQPTLYNVKPPLVIWLQCLSIWIFGANEFAIRLPSTLAALLTCFAVFYFAKRNLNPIIGILAVLFLVTTDGYIRIHVSRSGDLDSVLVLFITLYSLLFFDYLLNSPQNSKKYLALIGLLVFCAFLSKSVAGLMPILGLFLGMIAVKKGREVLENRFIYLVAFTTLLLCGSYYAIREYLSNGYLEKVKFSEYLRFTKNIMSWHEHPFWYYLDNMYERFYKYYILFLPLTLIGIFSKNWNFRRFSILGIIFSVSYFLLISYPIVKLEWYDAPLYPMLSLLLASTLYQFVSLIIQSQPYKSVVLAFLCLLIFTLPYYKIYTQNTKFLPTESLEYDGFAIRELSRTSPNMKNYKVLLPTKEIEHIDQANFYIKSLNHFKNYEIKLIKNVQEVENNDVILCSNSNALEKIKQKFKVEEISTIYESKLIRIKSEVVQFQKL